MLNSRPLEKEAIRRGGLAWGILWFLGLVLAVPAGAVLEPLPEKCVVLTFDDSVKSHHTVVGPLLKELGFSATFFITEGFEFKTNKTHYMTWEEIRELHEAGFEIGNHTRDHMGVTRQNLGRLRDQLETINGRCRKHGIPIPVSFAYPGNAFSVEALGILKEMGIRWARRGGSPEYTYEEGGGVAYEPGRDHPLLIPSVGDARPDWTLENFKAALARTAEGTIPVLQFHGVPDLAHPWVHTPPERFREYMGYLKENGYRVLALRDLGRYVDGNANPSDPEEIIRERIRQRKKRERPRARDLGVPFPGQPGAQNAITDVAGVLVGHTTLIEGEGSLVVGKGPVRTGVTAVLPVGRTYRPVFAAWDTLNGNGELTGTTWIEESGLLEEPILLTNTRSVGAVHEAVWSWRKARGYHDPESGIGWAALPVVGETWDGRLNDIHGNHVRSGHVFAALDGARSGWVEEGNVGGGTGMVCHRFKGGIGTASRVVEQGYTVGVLVQANYGPREALTVAGVPVGREIRDLMPQIHSMQPGESKAFEGNSILVIVATDAPLLPHQLKRLAKRSTVGIARVGGFGANSSGDLFLAFSTAPMKSVEEGRVREVRMVSNDEISPLFVATAEAVEESIVNALVAAESMVGINGNRVHALPHDRLVEMLKRYNRLAP